MHKAIKFGEVHILHSISALLSLFSLSFLLLPQEEGAEIWNVELEEAM